MLGRSSSTAIDQGAMNGNDNPGNNYYQDYQYSREWPNSTGPSPLETLIETHFQQMGMKMDAMLVQQKETDGKVADLQKCMQNLAQRQKKSEENMKDAQQVIQHLQKQNEDLSSRVEWLQRESIMHKIRVFNYPGLQEPKTEQERKVEFLTYVNLKLLLKLDAQEINRISIAGKGTKRHLLVQFLFWPSKINVMRHLKNLKTTDPDSKISFQDDLTQAELQTKKENLPLLSEMKAAASPDQKVTMRRGTICINGQRQTKPDLQKIKTQIRNNAPTNLNFPAKQPPAGATGFSNSRQEIPMTQPTLHPQ